MLKRKRIMTGVGVSFAAALLGAGSARAEVCPFIPVMPEPIAITGTPLNAYASWARDVWPDSEPSRIADMVCCRDRICTIKWRPTVMDDDTYLEAELDTLVHELPEPSQIIELGPEDFEVIYPLLYTRTQLDYDEETGEPDPQGEAITLRNITAATFSVTASEIECVHLWTDYADDWTVLGRRGQVKLHQECTGSTRLRCLRDGTCRGLPLED